MEDEEEQLLRQQYEQLSRHQLIVANERHDAIVTIADEMEQLHGLFRQLEEQVDEQSPLIQHIEDTSVPLLRICKVRTKNSKKL